MTSATDNWTRETTAIIITRDVAVKAECPNCGCETTRDIHDFDETDLWYGQEAICCEECGKTYQIYNVERDV